MKEKKDESGTKKVQAHYSEKSGVVTEEAIRERAYEIFQERRQVGGPSDPIMDWLEAEHELCDGRKRGDGRSEHQPLGPNAR